MFKKVFFFITFILLTTTLVLGSQEAGWDDNFLGDWSYGQGNPFEEENNQKEMEFYQNKDFEQAGFNNERNNLETPSFEGFEDMAKSEIGELELNDPGFNNPFFGDLGDLKNQFQNDFDNQMTDFKYDFNIEQENMMLPEEETTFHDLKEQHGDFAEKWDINHDLSQDGFNDFIDKNPWPENPMETGEYKDFMIDPEEFAEYPWEDKQHPMAGAMKDTVESMLPDWVKEKLGVSDMFGNQDDISGNDMNVNDFNGLDMDSLMVIDELYQMKQSGNDGFGSGYNKKLKKLKDLDEYKEFKKQLVDEFGGGLSGYSSAAILGDTGYDDFLFDKYIEEIEENNFNDVLKEKKENYFNENTAKLNMLSKNELDSVKIAKKGISSREELGAVYVPWNDNFKKMNEYEEVLKHRFPDLFEEYKEKGPANMYGYKAGKFGNQSFFFDYLLEHYEKEKGLNLEDVPLEEIEKK